MFLWFSYGFPMVYRRVNGPGTIFTMVFQWLAAGRIRQPGTSKTSMWPPYIDPPVVSMDADSKTIWRRRFLGRVLPVKKWTVNMVYYGLLWFTMVSPGNWDLYVRYG